MKNDISDFAKLKNDLLVSVSHDLDRNVQLMHEYLELVRNDVRKLSYAPDRLIKNIDKAYERNVALIEFISDLTDEIERTTEFSLTSLKVMLSHELRMRHSSIQVPIVLAEHTMKDLESSSDYLTGLIRKAHEISTSLTDFVDDLIAQIHRYEQVVGDGQ